MYVTRIPPTLPLAPLPHWYDYEGQRALDRRRQLAWRHAARSTLARALGASRWTPSPPWLVTAQPMPFSCPLWMAASCWAYSEHTTG